MLPPVNPMPDVKSLDCVYPLRLPIILPQEPTPSPNGPKPIFSLTQGVVRRVLLRMPCADTLRRSEVYTHFSPAPDPWLL